MNGKNGDCYQVTIEIGNLVKTVVDRSSCSMEKCLRDGELFDFVDEVNAALMKAYKLNADGGAL